MTLPSSELKNKYSTFSQNFKIVFRLVMIDQISKWWFISTLKHKAGMTIELLPILDLVYTWNYGISFGLFTGYHQYSNYAFIFINSLVTLYICYILLNHKSLLEFISYSFIVGGAIGNIIDRLVHGAVFDFIYLHYKAYGFFVFNLADSFITIGAIIIVINYFRERNKNIVESEIKQHYDELSKKADIIRAAKK